MKPVDPAKLPMLQNFDLFGELRSAIRRSGLAHEESSGIGAYLAASSRFFRDSLRLALREQTEGSADYLVHRIASLFPSGTFVEISHDSKEEWKRFRNDSERRVVYLPEGDRSGAEGTANRFEVGARRLTWAIPTKRRERVVEQIEKVEAAFACISANHGFYEEYEPRWLTMQLGKPPWDEEPGGQLSKLELRQWHQVQALAERRAQAGISLPDWMEVVVEQSCADYRAARHLPTFLQAWKTMCLLRSLQKGAKNNWQGPLVASFEDFAATGMLMRKLFKEGHWFPSPKKIFATIGNAGDETSVLSPITGKGVVYQNPKKRPAWAPVI
jgi:hypothetical protein